MSSRDNECADFYKFLDYARYTFSTVITLAALGLIIYCISHGYAAISGHPVILLIIFVIVTVLLAYLEGLQIAIMALEKQDREAFKHLPRSYHNHVLATKNHGKKCSTVSCRETVLCGICGVCLCAIDNIFDV